MLIAKNLSYCLGEKCLINDISITFRPGILYGILGPNGSGKSTLLKTLSGVWKASSGDVLWHGERLHSRTRREVSQTISLVPQYAPMHFEFTVHDMVSMGRYPHSTGWLSKNELEIVEWGLRTVDVWHLRDHLVTQVSQGERQRAYIARALVTQSPVLLLDEPTASLDIRHQLEIWKLLQQLKQGNRIIAVTIHDLSSCERFCEQVVLLNRGQSVGVGEFHNVVTQEVLSHVFGVKSLALASSGVQYFSTTPTA